MKFGICGIGGRMGRAILGIALERGHELSAAIDNPASPCFGQSAGGLVNRNDINIKIGAVDSFQLKGIEVIIDFSSPQASLALLPAASDAGVPVVIGTTGFSEDEKSAIAGYSKKIPVLISPNMSLGVNLLFKLTEIAAGALNTSYDVEIIEAHHRFKKDAPSGTAKRLVEAVRKMDGLKDAKEVTGRDGITGERTNREIGVLAMRGGDIVGDHTVFFVTAGERLELTHRASSRDILARGAVTAAEFLRDRGPGLYNMFDVLGL